MPVAQLLTVMEKLTEVHKELLALAERKRVALIRNTVDEVSEVANKENRLLRTVEALLEEQANATNLFFKSKGFQPVRAINVTELSRLITDPGLKRNLLEKRDQLSDIVTQLKAKNELNQSLIQQSIAFVNYSLDVVLGPEEEPVYQNPASLQANGGKRSGYFDSRA